MIASNLTALNTHNQLKKNQTNQSNSLNKLASGLRINKAGDDSAGLAISEKMRGQIRGLSQASRNSQDGISLIQTVEGGLSGVHTHLQRMRELTIQAKNDTNEKSDRKEVQKEIDQLNEGINSLAKNTEFNGISLMGEEPKPLEVVFLIDDSGTMAGPIDAVQDGIAEFAGALNNGGNVRMATISVVNERGMTIADRKMDFTEDPQKIEKQLTNHSAHAGSTAPYHYMKESMPDAGAGFTYTEEAEKVFVLLTDTGNELGTSVPGGGSDPDLTSAKIAELLAGDPSTEEDDVPLYVFGVGNFNQGNEGAYQPIIDEAGGEIYRVTSAEEIASSLNEDLLEDLSDKKRVKDFTLQIGANQGQTLEFQSSDIRPHILGTSKVDVVDSVERDNALSIIDNAIAEVSSERGRYGALQNRLEHTINNLENSAENLTAAESRIRDVDMASEMMEMTRANILSQSSQSILMQANQQPQQILQLLQ